MTVAHKLLSTCLPDGDGSGPPGGGSWSDDVFSTYLYAGNGTSQTINNGIDLAGKGGLVWCKGRTSPSFYHTLTDTTRGKGKELYTNNNNSEGAGLGVTAFLPTGFSVGASSDTNALNEKYVSWTFRRAERFFDIITYTGNGATSRAIAHGLNCSPGMLVVKRTDLPGDWFVQHRNVSASNTLYLNQTSAQTPVGNGWGGTPMTSTTFYVGGTDTNQPGATYVAYIWAHDTDTNGVVQCGSFTTDGSGSATVNLGWEPQYILYKNTQGGSGDINWRLLDSMRGFTVGNDASLIANRADSEASSTSANPTATGFQYNFGTNLNQQYIYLAIRRPNKPPTTGSQVYYNFATTDGTVGTQGYDFADVAIATKRSSIDYNRQIGCRLVGVGTGNGMQGKRLSTNNSAVEESYTSDNTAGALLSNCFGLYNNQLFANLSGTEGGVAHLLRRAPTFVDTVAYRGTGIPKTEKHNLAATPEMMWVKSRTATTPWRVYHKDTGNGFYLTLNSPAPKSAGITIWNSTDPTSTEFSIGTNVTVNNLNQDYIAYLFATCPGVSKVGSYIGNGTSQLINCGFSTGARLVLIKQSDGTGDWYMWDSARGIHPTADPYLSLNTTTAEVSSGDSIDPDINGFIVNQDSATNVNVLGGQYIFYAIS